MPEGVRPETKMAAGLVILALIPACINLSLASLLFIPGIAAVVYLWFTGASVLLAVSMLIATIAVSLLFGHLEGLFMLIGFAIPAVTVAALLQRRQGLVKSGLIAMLAPLVALAVNYPTIVRLVDFLNATMQRAVNDPQFTALYSAADRELVLSYAGWMTTAVDTLLPAILLTTLATIVFLGAGLGIILVRRQGLFVYGFRNFSRWKMPEWMLLPLGLGIVLLLTDIEFAGMIGWNLLFVLFLLYSLCGLSVIEYIMRSKKLSLPIRALVYAGLFLAQIIAAVLLPLIALFDSHFDYRRLRAKQIG